MKNFKTYYFQDTDLEKFYAAFRECVKVFGCVYMGYIYEDLSQNARIGFVTNPDWQKEYIGKHLIDDCHLWQSVSKYFVETNKESLILPWAMVKPQTSKQKDIVLYRSEKEIGENGISFCSRTKQGREYFCFAPEKNEHRFLKYVSTNMEIIRQYGSLFRKISYQSIPKKIILIK